MVDKTAGNGAHTSWFKLLAYQNNDLKYRLAPASLKAHVNQETLDYSTLVALLQEVIDAEFNIVRKYDAQNIKWVADEANAIPVEQRAATDSCEIAAYKSLLRSLTRIMKLQKDMQEPFRANFQLATMRSKVLRTKFAVYLEEVLMMTQSENGSDAEKLEAIRDGERFFMTYSFDLQHWFSLLVDKNETPVEYRLAPSFTNNYIVNEKLSYSMLVDLLRATNDAQFGIHSYYDQHENTWMRDATDSDPLENRMAHDSPVIEANNALLRCLARLRPIEFAIQRKHGVNSEFSTHLSFELRWNFADIAQAILTLSQADQPNKKGKLAAIAEIEKTFNTSLILKLHEANLTEGCVSAKDAEKLLLYYRNLSAVLEPARNLMTLTYDEKAKVLARETQYPITVKTRIQQTAVAELNQIQIYPLKEDMTAHTSSSLAMQEADRLFAELLAKDDRLLAAQARKTHVVGVKNAFIVKTDLIQIAPDGLVPEVLRASSKFSVGENSTLWLGRSGSPVYLGKGEGDTRVQQHTQENIEQIRQAAMRLMDKDGLAVHVTSLNTDTRHQNQDAIIRHVYQATRHLKIKQDSVSHIPTNTYGTAFPVDVDPELTLSLGNSLSGRPVFQKATRLQDAVDVCDASNRARKTLNLVHCASGQDRTGTVVEKYTQQWMQNWYKEQNIKINSDVIEASRARGGNAAEVASHLIPGSPGMKGESKADDLRGNKKTFSKAASREFYRKSADTNKKNKVGAVAFLSTPNAILLQKYTKNLELLETQCNAPHHKKLQLPLQKVIDCVKALGVAEGAKTDSRTLSDLNLVLSTSLNAFTSLNALRNPNKNSSEFKQEIKQMAALANHFNTKSSSPWRILGNALLVLAGSILVAAGILAAIPSGGSSLLLTVVGALGLTMAVASVGGAVATLGVAGAGCRFFSSRKEKNLASALLELKEKIATVDDNTASTDDKLQDINC